jgi:hypothetical protein
MVKKRVHNLSRGLAAALMVVAPVLLSAGSARASTTVHDRVLEFVRNPSSGAWEQAVLAARTGPRDSEPTAYSLVVDYYVAMMKRDLPNSMALVGTTPAQFVAAQQEQLESITGQLRTKDNPGLWDVVEMMATQQFDETLVRAASEIAWRVSPNQFTALAARLAVRAPSNCRIFREQREQLLRDTKTAARTPASGPARETRDTGQ